MKREMMMMVRRSLSLCMRVGRGKGYGGRAVIRVGRYREEAGGWFSSKVSRGV